MYIYHFKQSNMVGSKLIPLNQQKRDLKEAYDEHVKKYEGRDWLLEKKVPILDCLWNDVLHFSPLNPQYILDTYRTEGLMDLEGRTFDVFKIPAELLREKNTVCFISENFDFQDYSEAKNKFWKFDLEAYKELSEVPPKQIEVWHEDKAQGRPLFWYSHTMHILSQDIVDVKDCEIITCR